MNAEQMIFGLDIGTRSIVGTVGHRKNNGRFAVEAMSVRFHETRAMLDGQIHDIGKVAETIIKVKKDLEDKTGCELREVCIAAAGRILKTVTVTSDYDMGGDTVIEAEHIRSVELLGVELAHNELKSRSENEKEGFYCVGYTVVKYLLNGNVVLKPLGHKGSSLGAVVLATFLPNDVVDGLYSAVEMADLSVANLTLEPIAAMQLAIPEKYRLLNLALVDIGAGTSDICITGDGSVIAYGMLPEAGDLLTEAIMRELLTDFDMAESVKAQLGEKKSIVYTDIMGLKKSVQPGVLKKKVDMTADRLAMDIADKISELNGGSPVSAVFLVGGGGKYPGTTKKIAAALGLNPERVALRGEEVLCDIEFNEEGIAKDALIITPIGICLNYYEQNSNFIFVRFNGERVKLYDNGKLTIADAAVGIGYPNERLFSRRGAALEFSVNGNRRMLRGRPGEAAVILLNGKEAGINTPVEPNDVIEVKESTIGQDASCTLAELPEYKHTITFMVNGKKVICPRFLSVNGELVSEFYEIRQNDVIEAVDFYTLGQILDFIDLPYEGVINVNHMIAVREDKVYENFSIDFELEEEKVYYPESRTETGAKNAQEIKSDGLQTDIVTDQVNGNDTVVFVNGDIKILQGKKKHILVDILDVVEFDTSQAAGRKAVIKLNGEKADFTMPIHDSDHIELYWEE